MFPNICTQCGAPLKDGKCEHCGTSYSVAPSPSIEEYPRIYKPYSFLHSASLSPSPSLSPSLSASPSPSEEMADDERDEYYKQKIINESKKEFLPAKILRKLGF